MTEEMRNEHKSHFRSWFLLLVLLLRESFPLLHGIYEVTIFFFFASSTLRSSPHTPSLHYLSPPTQPLPTLWPVPARMFSFEQNLYGTGLFWCKGDRVTNYSPRYPGWCSGIVSFQRNTCPCIYPVDAVVHLEGLHVFSTLKPITFHLL